MVRQTSHDKMRFAVALSFFCTLDLTVGLSLRQNPLVAKCLCVSDRAIISQAPKYEHKVNK
jgi:hypothetical protein